MSNRLLKLIGLEGLSKKERGLAYIFLITFVPLFYKLIVPFFVIAGLGEYTIIINGTIVAIGIILSGNHFFKTIKGSDIFFYLFIALFLVLNPLIYPTSDVFVEKNFLNFMLQVVPYYFIGLALCCDNRDKILLFVAKWGIITQVFWQACIMIGLVEHEGSVVDGSLGEQMEVAYSLLFPIFVLFVDLMKKFDIVNIILLLLGVMLLFFMGTRGPIVVFAVFLLIYYVVLKNFKSYNILKKGIIVGLFVLFYYYIVPICAFIAPFAASLGFSTRVFDSIVEQAMVNMDSASNRDDFYGSVFSAIQSNGIGIGYGWGGDRLHTPTGGYAHNLELELLCQFGIVGAGIIFVVLAVILCKSYFRNKQYSEIWLTMLCVGPLSLQFSESYVTYPLFFVAIGYFVSSARNNVLANRNIINTI